jgi:poly(A) polymerase
MHLIDTINHQQTLSYLQQISSWLQSQHCQVYLVGGSVRNLLLHEPCTDWDIAIAGNTLTLAKQLAHQLHGHFVYMHDKAHRVVIKAQQYTWSCDLSPLHGESITADLAARDFTINAIAIPLADVLTHLTQGTALPFIDPFNGASDIHNRQLRIVQDTVFQTDPLRMLRAIRFMQRYHLTLTPETAQAIQHDSHLLLQVAAERIHEELYAILHPQGATTMLHLLDKHGLLSVIFPELLLARHIPQPELHHWDVFDHSLETVGYLEQLATLLQPDAQPINKTLIGGDQTAQSFATIQQLLVEAETQALFQHSTLLAPATKLAALLHDIGKPATYAQDAEGNVSFYHHPQAGIPIAQQIMRRLHASTQDRRLVQQVVAHHMRPGQLSNTAVTPRAIRRYFVDLGPTGITVALVSLADHLAMRGPQPLTAHWQHHLNTVLVLLQNYIRDRQRLMPPHLLQPNELIQHLSLSPSPLIGQLLNSLAEAQMDGLIKSKSEALWFAEEEYQRRLQQKP